MTEKFFPIGCGVLHKKYGKGLVLEISDGFIKVEFINRGLVELSINETINKKLLKRI